MDERSNKIMLTRRIVFTLVLAAIIALSSSDLFTDTLWWIAGGILFTVLMLRKK